MEVFQPSKVLPSKIVVNPSSESAARKGINAVKRIPTQTNNTRFMAPFYANQTARENQIVVLIVKSKRSERAESDPIRSLTHHLGTTRRVWRTFVNSKN